MNKGIVSMSMIRRAEFMGEKFTCSECGERNVSPERARECMNNESLVICEKCGLDNGSKDNKTKGQ